MGYFPFFINIENKKILIIGGGKVAYRKIKTLIEFKAEITVISSKFCDELIELSNYGKIVLNKSYFQETDIDISNFFCVISATDNEEINKKISEVCMNKNILVNIADDMEKCSFIFPSIVKDEDIIIGVTTSGKSPTMSKIIKENIKRAIPNFYSEVVSKTGHAREVIKKTVVCEKDRKKILKNLTTLGIEKKGKLNNNDVDEVINNVLNINEKELD